MPELSFVLPHWLYWSGLLFFPLAAFFLYRYSKRRPSEQPVSLILGYFLLLTGGFVGVHRLYLKSRWAFVFVAVFVAVLVVNIETREAREIHSEAVNGINLADAKISRSEKAIRKAEKRIEIRNTEHARQKLDRARSDLDDGKARLEEARLEEQKTQAEFEAWKQVASGLGLLLLLGILVDALLLPRLVRARNLVEAGEPVEEGFQCPVVEQEHDDSKEPLLFNRTISRVNGFAGEFVAYWSIIAVFVYYYEVIARYVFNSPTNWAHEAMFLMFGTQYLIAGGFCLRENAHVRVDVIYSQLSKRTRAIMDVITSVFFFVFTVTLLTTGWIFFHDSFEINEVSFTEWGIQYWPIKFALPLGAALLIAQGISQLIKDIAVLRYPDLVDLDTETRPEG